MIQSNKAQGLPLNTTVVAIIVIIVMLTILVFFVTNLGETGNQIDSVSSSQCSLDNPAIATANFEEVISTQQYQGLSEDNQEEFSNIIGVENCYGR